jgi:hypothetical protein
MEKKKKLVLKTQTIARLTQQQLERVAGAGICSKSVWTNHCPTMTNACPTVGCPPISVFYCWPSMDCPPL